MSRGCPGPASVYLLQKRFRRGSDAQSGGRAVGVSATGYPSGATQKPKGNTSKRPQVDHTHTHQHTLTLSDTKQQRQSRVQNSASADRPQYTPNRVGTQAQLPGHQNRPCRGAHPPNRQHTCTHFLQTQTRRYTHSEIQINRQIAAANHVRAHTSSRQRKHRQTLGRGHVRAHPAPGTHHRHPPTHQQETPRTPSQPAAGTAAELPGPLLTSSPWPGVAARTSPHWAPPPP